mmetsp:Transcript_127874/g.370067  ORF Transcript_127874/g.370067 Transcript_127874/m.370067 type:complete len:327 (-) Transcript_127874:79-1059(-)|eukprot:CAMPEP_0176002450 /NCGR_PEP_ID=MMETSP0120_2-20121206/653_1 /TAXON_ID=160619 /ORGANISM="Kryptoperidinium foliaceum, Strain CCMP 1326" /LENGTH=326 /DNA_ID=CAMNT_0017335039 /DNA_START=123 /DNA_END=1103 /DNA_ORIENTATION=-
MPIEISDKKKESEAIALMKARLSGFETEEGRLKGLSYRPKFDNEVVITTSPKAGTTWMQQICHQLRSAEHGGDMAFDEISEVVPWLELAHDQKQDLEAPQYGHYEGLPRIFKSHAWEGHCPKFPKTIVVLRNPEDVVVSFYKFFEDWFFEPGSISLEAFAEEFWLARGVPPTKMQNASYFVHLISWYKRKDDPNVLILFFEDLKYSLKEQVQLVAKFISDDKHNFCRPELVDVAVKKSCYNFMKEHESQFDEKLSKSTRNEACGLPPDAGTRKSKIAKGAAGSGKVVLTDELKAAIDAKWNEVVMPVTGCATYEELRMQFNMPYYS